MLGDIPITVQPNLSIKDQEVLHGLDPLHPLKQVFITRSRNVTPATNRTLYEIINNNGEVIFNAVESNYAFSRNCCNDLRKFEFSILQCHDQQEVLRFRRPFRPDCCCCFGHLQRLDILTFPEDNIIGSIFQEWSLCQPRFVINLPNGDALFRAMGACCTMRCCVRELNFDVTTHNRQSDVALISCKWMGLLREEFEDVLFYGVEFHRELNVKLKALILGVCVLVNALYYKI